MRRRLIVVAAAISLMVTVAFLAPLIVLVRTVARDRAINDAGGRNVVRLWVPNALLEKGVSKATFTLVGLGALLVLGALFVSDRLGASMVRPVRRLATAAARLGEGDLAQRVEPDGPKEV